MPFKLIKIGGPDYIPSEEDLERWRQLFIDEKISIEEVKMMSPDITVEEVDDSRPGVTLVKVGGNGYTPTVEELENWRKVFEEAKNDPDFKIFTHDAVQIEHIDIDITTIVE